jgi:GNAT superfamily N-acetyltransferase
MQFVDLAEAHIPEAIALAEADLDRETRHVPALAQVDVSAVLAERVADIIRDGVGGVAALENGRLAGYLTFMGPFERFFGDLPGAWSPLHAHAIGADDRERTWSLLVQHAAERLVAQDVTGLSIAAYAHDEGTRGLVLNSFGIRLADAIRDLSIPFPFAPSDAATYGEIAEAELAGIVPLENSLIRHLRSSPTFVPVRETTEAAFLSRQAEEGARFFGAWIDSTLAGYVKVTDDGENFVTESPAMPNISGAYLLPEHRGHGIYESLVAVTANTLRDEGAPILGVDFETMNPAALRFWTNWFDIYTYGHVRRIDDRILEFSP